MMVAQEDFSGCGVACAAALLGRTYQEARALFAVPQKAVFKGFFCSEIVGVLAKKGVKAKVSYVGRRQDQDFPVGTIVYIAKSEDYPDGHYLLRFTEGWMDPWINFPRLEKARAGLRKSLPGKPQYAVILD